MATDDQSLATLVENWIVATLVAIADPDLTDRHVEVFQGTVNPVGQLAVEELAAHSSPRIVVSFEGDRHMPLAEGQARYEGVYGLYIVVRSERPGAAARRGDGTTIGTNKLRDVIRAALHDKSPDAGGGGYHTELTEWRGVQTAFEGKDKFILRAELVVAESPTAA